MDEDQKRGEGKDELNLAEFPLAVLMDRVPDTLKTVTHEFSRHDAAAGGDRKRRLIITASDLYGLPNSVDEDVIIALIQATREANGFSSPTVHFTVVPSTSASRPTVNVRSSTAQNVFGPVNGSSAMGASRKS